MNITIGLMPLLYNIEIIHVLIGTRYYKITENPTFNNIKELPLYYSNTPYQVGELMSVTPSLLQRRKNVFLEKTLVKILPS